MVRLALGRRKKTRHPLISAIHSIRFEDHPVNTALFFLLIFASFLFLVGFWAGDPSSSSYSPLLPVSSFADRLKAPLYRDSSASVSSTGKFRFSGLSGCTKLAVFLALLVAVRIELFRKITVYSECVSAVGYQYSIPFYVALYDYFSDLRYRPVGKYVPADEQPVNITLRLLYKFVRRSRHYLLRGRHRYLIAAGLVSLGGLFVSTLHAGRSSTYICPSISSEASYIPAFKKAGAAIDILLVIGLTQLAREWMSGSVERRKAIPYQSGSLLLGVAFIWLMVGVILTHANAYGGSTLHVYGNYVNSMVGQGILVTCLLGSASQLVRLDIRMKRNV